MNVDAKNYYEILNVPTNADFKTIKKAYVALCLKHHPDKNKDEENLNDDTFIKQINEAYSILSDINKRKHYDLTFDKTFTNAFTNIFANSFTNKTMVESTELIEKSVTIKIDNLKPGYQFKIKYNRRNNCRKCEMTGIYEKKLCKENTCDVCNGSVLEKGYLDGKLYVFPREVGCKKCDNTGIYPKTKTCESCLGRKFTIDSVILNYKLPDDYVLGDAVK